MLSDLDKANNNGAQADYHRKIDNEMEPSGMDAMLIEIRGGEIVKELVKWSQLNGGEEPGPRDGCH
jgi:hypothetical protein